MKKIVYLDNIPKAMKTKLLLMMFVMFLCFSTTSCVITRRPHYRHPHKEIPPGHAKKIHKHKSAKYHAPGHEHRP